jgi:hypothetical protein
MPRIHSIVAVPVLGVVLFVCVSSTEVQASLRFCNQTDSPVSLSTAWMTVPVVDEHVVRARGWWLLAPNECRIVVSDLDASKAMILFHAHSRDLTWGKKIPYETGPDGHTHALTGLGRDGGKGHWSEGLCVRTAMFDREMILARGITMHECERGFYPAGFWWLAPSKDKNLTHNLTRRKLTSE